MKDSLKDFWMLFYIILIYVNLENSLWKREDRIP